MDDSPVFFDADPDLLDLLPSYLAARKKEVDTLKAALTTGDLATVKRIAHNVKGTAGAYGLPALGAIAHQLEKAAGSGDHAQSTALVNDLAALLLRVRLP